MLSSTKWTSLHLKSRSSFATAYRNGLTSTEFTGLNTRPTTQKKLPVGFGQRECPQEIGKWVYQTHSLFCLPVGSLVDWLHPKCPAEGSNPHSFLYI